MGGQVSKLSAEINPGLSTREWLNVIKVKRREKEYSRERIIGTEL